MEKKLNDVMVVAYENLGEVFKDNTSTIDSKERTIRGRVEMYEIVDGEKKKIFERDNLVVYAGREWIASKIFNTNNVEITPSLDEFICWLGLGSGGTIFGDPFDPSPPSSTNTDLVTPIVIHATDNIYCGDLRADGYYKHLLDEVIFEQDEYNGDSWLIARVLITIGQDDAINNQINEAGLFTAVSNEGGFSGEFHLFARVTFPSVYKDNSRQLVLVWYIYC